MNEIIEYFTENIQKATTDEERARAYGERGNAYLLHKQYQNAITDFKNEIDMTTDENIKAFGYSGMGKVYSRIGEHEKAIAYCKNAIDLATEENVRALSHISRGNAYNTLGQYENAIADYKTAIELDADENLKVSAHEYIGDAYYELEQYKKVIVYYTEAISLYKDDKDKASMYLNRGNAYNELQQYDAGISDYTHLINQYNDNNYRAMAYYNRGITYGKLKKQNKAIDDYKKAIIQTCNYSRSSYQGEKTFYKFVPINAATLILIENQLFYFSDIKLLNDPLECPFVQEDDFFRREVFVKEYEPRICSLVLPCSDEDKCEKLPVELPVEDYLKFFSHYAESHKGICIEYIIKHKFLEENKNILYTRVKYQDIKSIGSIENHFAIKHTQWKYENEARFVAFGEKSTYLANEEEGVKITKIFFGLKTSDEDKERVCKILHGRGIQFFKSKNKGYSLLDVKIEPL